MWICLLQMPVEEDEDEDLIVELSNQPFTSGSATNLVRHSFPLSPVMLCVTITYTLLPTFQPIPLSVFLMACSSVNNQSTAQYSSRPQLARPAPLQGMHKITSARPLPAYFNSKCL